MSYEYVDKNREGDHICYISNLDKLKRHYPGWTPTRSLNDYFRGDRPRLARAARLK